MAMILENGLLLCHIFLQHVILRTKGEKKKLSSSNTQSAKGLITDTKM